MLEVLGLIGFRDYDAIWNCFMGSKIPVIPQKCAPGKRVLSKGALHASEEILFLQSAAQQPRRARDCVYNYLLIQAPYFAAPCFWIAPCAHQNSRCSRNSAHDRRGSLLGKRVCDS